MKGDQGRTLPEYPTVAQAIAWAMWRKPYIVGDVNFENLGAEMRLGGHNVVCPNAYDEMIAKLESGKLKAYASDGEGKPVTIEPVEFSRIYLWGEPWRHRPYIDIRFRRADLIRIWPPETAAQRGAPPIYDWGPVQVWARAALVKRPAIKRGQLAESLLAEYEQKIGKPPSHKQMMRRLSTWDIPET